MVASPARTTPQTRQGGKCGSLGPGLAGRTGSADGARACAPVALPCGFGCYTQQTLCVRSPAHTLILIGQPAPTLWFPLSGIRGRTKLRCVTHRCFPVTLGAALAAPIAPARSASFPPTRRSPEGGSASPRASCSMLALAAPDRAQLSVPLHMLVLGLG